MKSLLVASAVALVIPAYALAQDHSGHHPAPQPQQPAQDHAGHHPAPDAQPPAAADPHAGHRPSTTPPAAEHAGMDHDQPSHPHTGALGPYPMTREASGTAWQPDQSLMMPMAGMVMRGPWMLMGHATLNTVYSWQDGPRGDDKVFLAGMVMGMATRNFANGDTLQFRAMLSPDPFMGGRGYPLLLASGETADGIEPLVDRQHPHDLFMELSVSYSRRIGERSSVFLYAGLPGEPAFGPPAFMHRQSIMDSPEAPISHHWLDSTHITFGVLTAGVVHDNLKLEVSRFRGREPDQHRYDIEVGELDSTAARVSWNPTPSLSLQASWARVISSEQLEPDEDHTRWSASAIYTRRFGADRWWSVTGAWGRRTSAHDPLDAWVLEGAVQPLTDWTFYGRAEQTENNELLSHGGHHGETFTVSKVSIGAIRDFRVNERTVVGLGAQATANFIPADLESEYGGNPVGAMVFVRLKLH